MLGCCAEAQGSHVGEVAVEVERVVVVVVEERLRVGLRMKERWNLWASACGRPPSCSGVVVLSRNRRELLLDDISFDAEDADAGLVVALCLGRKRSEEAEGSVLCRTGTPQSKTQSSG
jgi:hypothetical protein